MESAAPTVPKGEKKMAAPPLKAKNAEEDEGVWDTDVPIDVDHELTILAQFRPTAEVSLRFVVIGWGDSYLW